MRSAVGGCVSSGERSARGGSSRAFARVAVSGQQPVEARDDLPRCGCQVHAPPQPDDPLGVAAPPPGQDVGLDQRGCRVRPPGEAHHQPVRLALLAAVHRHRRQHIQAGEQPQNHAVAAQQEVRVGALQCPHRGVHGAGPAEGDRAEAGVVAGVVAEFMCQHGTQLGDGDPLQQRDTEIHPPGAAQQTHQPGVLADRGPDIGDQTDLVGAGRARRGGDVGDERPQLRRLCGIDVGAGLLLRPGEGRRDEGEGDEQPGERRNRHHPVHHPDVLAQQIGHHHRADDEREGDGVERHQRHQ